MALVQAFRKNVAKEIAQMSGGEYTTFTGDKKFEARVVEEAKHARNRYLLTFRPSNPAPGLHTLRVRLAQDYGAHIVARANYWVEEEPAAVILYTVQQAVALPPVVPYQSPVEL